MDFKSAVSSINKLIEDSSSSNEFIFQTGTVERVTEDSWSETSVSSTPIYQINGVIHGGHVRSITSHHTKTNLVVQFKDGSKRKSSFNTELDVVEGHQVTFAYHKESGDLVLFTNDDTGCGFWTGNEVMKADHIQQMLNQDSGIKISFFKELLNPLRLIYTQFTLAMAAAAGLIMGWLFIPDNATLFQFYLTIMTALGIFTGIIFIGSYSKIKKYTKDVGIMENLIFAVGFCISMYFWMLMWFVMFKEGPVIQYLLLSHFTLMVFSYPAKKHGLKNAKSLTNTFQKEQAIHYQGI